MRKSQNPRINLETTLVRMAYLEPMIPLDDILSRMEGLEKRLTSGGIVQSKPTAYEIKEASPVPSRELFSLTQAGMVDEVHSGYDASDDKKNGDIWEGYREFVKKRWSPLGSKIESGEFVSFENRHLKIGIHKDYSFLIDENDKNRLAEIAKEYFGEDVAVKIEPLESDSGNRHNQTKNGTANNNRTNDIKRDALSHPLLQKVLDVFDGAVVREVITKTNNE